MNISDKNIEKLIEMKKSFYEEIKSEVKDKNGILTENKNNYNLLQCKKKILDTILNDIEKYNKINTKISAL